MAFIDVVTLAEAKQYLRVDDGFTADDSLITTLINVGGEYVEKHTNHLLFSREKTYKFYDGEKRVYDYPINSITSPAEADMEITEYSLYTLYEYSSGDLVLNVGYDLPSSVPALLKMKMLEIVDAMYNGNDISAIVNFGEDLYESLSPYRRFTL
jgi:hypothetical protein